MIVKMIWERYILREILKVFFLFLGCFFSSIPLSTTLSTCKISLSTNGSKFLIS